MSKNKIRQINLIKTLEVQTASYKQEEMMNFILLQVKSIDPDAEIEIDDGNIYVTKGKADTYPCVVSHMDTVHSLHPNSRVFNFNGKLFSIDFQTMRRIGTGGDDKVGVFVCLEMLKEFDNIKLAFFRDEEVGCIGSAAAKMSFFEDVSFALQCDRKGYRDFVSSISGTRLYSKVFSEEIQGTLKKWGKKETSGGLTDVYQLAENGIGVCVANMSCGYHDPHTDNEYCVVNEVLDTTDFVKDLIDVLYTDGERWEIKHDVWSNYRSYGGWGGHHGAYRDFGTGWTPKKPKNVDAEWITGNDINSIENEEADPFSHTPDCPNCDSAHAAYYDPTEGDYYCYNCGGYYHELEDIIRELNEENKKLSLPEHLEDVEDDFTD